MPFGIYTQQFLLLSCLVLGGEISVAGDWAESCFEDITTMKELLQVPATCTLPWEQAVRSEPSAAGIPTFLAPFPKEQGSWFPAVSQPPQAAKGGKVHAWETRLVLPHLVLAVGYLLGNWGGENYFCRR